jgi:hypothetical protein
LWNPTPQLADGTFGIGPNGFGFTITGAANIPIVIEASLAANGPWTLLQSGMLTNGSIYFRDAQWTNYPSRFYRIRSP